jgi:SHS2 domain-containing protein
MYEIFEHTADFGIRARAETLDALFVEAAKGLFSIMLANPDSVRAIVEVPFRVDSDDAEGLLHGWLGELLYMFTARRLALTDFSVRIDGSPPIFSGLIGSARGEPIDPSRHEIDVEVKAITWHGLKIEQDAGGWMAEVIVDV